VPFGNLVGIKGAERFELKKVAKSMLLCEPFQTKQKLAKVKNSMKYFVSDLFIRFFNLYIGNGFTCCERD